MSDRWHSPKSTEEMDQIITEAKALVLEMDHESVEFEIMLTELALFAGCFNHHITHQQRGAIIALLGSIVETALYPVLDALVSVPRVEQYDVTKAFIDYLRK